LVVWRRWGLSYERGWSVDRWWVVSRREGWLFLAAGDKGDQENNSSQENKSKTCIFEIVRWFLGWSWCRFWGGV